MTEPQQNSPDPCSIPPLYVGTRVLSARLVLGTTGATDLGELERAVAASGASVATLAPRRYSPRSTAAMAAMLRRLGVDPLPDTSGCCTAEEAVQAAVAFREDYATPLIKLEVIADERTLLPDVVETLAATERLAEMGFFPMVHTSDDPAMAARLEQAGAAAIMPAGAPVGTGLGLLNPYNIELIAARAGVPVILEAGLGTASDAAQAMELGCDGVLAATAIHRAQRPATMAQAIAAAVTSGYLSRRSGPMPPRRESLIGINPEGRLGATVDNDGVIGLFGGDVEDLPEEAR